MKNSIRRVKIVGAGLIGTSIALRLKEKGLQVLISDLDPTNESMARDLIQETNHGTEESKDPFDLVIIATPISSIAELIIEEARRNPESRLVDISGLMSKVVNEVESFQRFPQDLSPATQWPDVKCQVQRKREQTFLRGEPGLSPKLPTPMNCRFAWQRNWGSS